MPEQTLEELKGHEIAVQRGTLGDQTLEQLGIPAMRITDTSRLAILLANHRVSVFVAEFASGFASAKEAGVTVKEAMPLAETLGYFVCSLAVDNATAERLAKSINEVFVEDLDRSLAKADGMDAAIYDRVRPPAVTATVQPTQ